MTVLQAVNSLINKYKELKEIADTQLITEYSKGWYAAQHQCKNKLSVLEELKSILTADNDVTLPLGKKQMFLLYGHSNTPIACIDPNLVTLIEVADYWDKSVKFYSRVRYREYDCIEEESIRFFATRAYLRIIDIETIKEAFPDIVLWTSIPTVDSWNAAWEMRTKIEDKFRKIFT